MKKIILISVLLFGLIASAETYYVKTGGNDASAGTADGAAWAHHPWMSTWTGSVTLQAGDSVMMNRGDTWSISGATAPYMEIAQSGTSGNTIVTSAYGIGAKPIIKIAADNAYPVIRGLGVSYITFNNLDIQHFEATQDALNAQAGIAFGKDVSLNVPHNWIIINCDIHNCPRSGIWGMDDAYRITVGDTSAISIATTTLYSNHIYDCGYGGVQLKGRNPVSDRSDFKVLYNYIHDIDSISGLARDAYGIAFSSSPIDIGQTSSDGWPTYCTARFNYVEDVPGHTGIDCHGGQYIYIRDNYVHNCKFNIDIFAADRTGYEDAILDYAYIEDNIITNPAVPTIGNCYFIVLSSEDPAYRVSHGYITNNEIYYITRPASETSSNAIVVQNVDGVIVDGNKLYNGPQGAGGAIGVAYTATTMAKNVIVRNNFIHNWDGGFRFDPDGIDGDLDIYCNIIKSHLRTLFSAGGTTGGDINIVNNVLLSGDITTAKRVLNFGVAAVTIGAGTTLTIENNIIGFSAELSDGRYIIPPSIITGTMTIDYNIYWNSTYATPFYYAGANHTYADWQGHGFDVNSPNVTGNLNPLFRNYTGRYTDDNDFDIKSLSPARDIATDVSLTGDYFGLKYGGNPSIGAIDYHKRLILVR
jgi:hypothetical protein